VLSLDFELRWGVLDRVANDLTAYRKHLDGEADAVHGMLACFAAHGLRATWAVVGAVACDGWDEWTVRAPAWPRYLDKTLAFDRNYRAADPKGTLYFAPRLVEAVRAAGHELASHTFSHVYFREPGFVRRDAEADTAAVQKLFRDRWGTRARSFVFPRNQVAFTDVLTAHGFRAWRENPDAPYWNATTDAEQRLWSRAQRLVDSVVPFGNRATDHVGARQTASHFVRFELPSALWKLHVHRIVTDARRTGPGAVLHLWWHPHNLGAAPRATLARLDELLDRLCDAAPAMRFATMNDVAMDGARDVHGTA